jgi:hypothetical protein
MTASILAEQVILTYCINSLAIGSGLWCLALGPLCIAPVLAYLPPLRQEAVVVGDGQLAGEHQVEHPALCLEQVEPAGGHRSDLEPKGARPGVAEAIGKAAAGNDELLGIYGSPRRPSSPYFRGRNGVPGHPAAS